jgi:aerobic-type carbon monoxide dehydrogenase small subunit (CoxS/CutS family)
MLSLLLLDALRERLGLAGSKKGCDHGQCGARNTLVRTLLDLTEEEKDRR